MANLAEGWINHLRRQAKEMKPSTTLTIPRSKVGNTTSKQLEIDIPNIDAPEDPSVTHMIKQPEIQPISQEQLVAEVKSIYAGLFMVESRCIEVDNAQSGRIDSPRLDNKQWQAIIALHRTLLHEHHDFFLASQHPSASSAPRRLARKYCRWTKAGMWRHGIHSFLELFRRRIPGLLEHVLTLIYLAYSMMALLYETVLVFADTWIKCLGALRRYDIWAQVSRNRNVKAPDEATTGRVHHHLAIPEGPDSIQQLYYHHIILRVAISFESFCSGILTLLKRPIGTQHRIPTQLEHAIDDTSPPLPGNTRTSLQTKFQSLNRTAISVHTNDTNGESISNLNDQSLLWGVGALFLPLDHPVSQTTRISTEAVASPATRQDLGEDTRQRQHNITRKTNFYVKAREPSADYSNRDRDQNEQPVILLRSVFDANSLLKWSYEWIDHRRHPNPSFTSSSGEPPPPPPLNQPTGPSKSHGWNESTSSRVLDT